ncbi:hypothetical protein Tco_0258376, partial [Tanacetum coccineum]
DDSKADGESEPVKQRPERHVSPTTSIPEIPTAPILPIPSIVVAPSSEHTPPDTTDVDSSTHRDLFIDHLPGLHGVARPISVEGLAYYLLCIHRRHLSRQLGILLPSHLLDHLARDAGPLLLS